MLGVMAWLMPLSVAISTFGSANGTIFAAGRLCKKIREMSDFMKFIKILINFFSGYVASREGHLVDILSFVHKENLTPAPALLFNVRIRFNLTKFFVTTPKKDLVIVLRTYYYYLKYLQAVIAFIMILGGDIDSLIDFFSFTVWIFYGMSMAAVILLRKTSPNLARPYKVPIFIPVLVLIGKENALFKRKHCIYCL